MKLSTKALAGISALVLTVTGAFVVTHSAQASPVSVLPWIHGAYLDHKPENISLFQEDTGYPLDAVSAFSLTSDIKTISWQAPAAKPVTDAGGNLILAVPLWQSNRSVGNTSGNTTDFTNLRNNLVAAGIANKTYIRLGWEMNIPFGYWSVTSSNRTAWVAAFKNAVNVLRANNSGIKIIFNPNAGPAQAPTDINMSQLAYDLRDYYEVVGLDFYNWDGGSGDGSMNTDAGWWTKYRSSYGIKGWLTWLTNNAPTKGFGFPEWGATSINTQSDNIVYIQHMISLFSTLSQGGTVDGVTYPPKQVIESYFNEPGFDYDPDWAGTITRFRYKLDSGALSTIQPAQLPVAETAYKNALASVAPTVVPSSSASDGPSTAPSSVPSCN